MLNKFTTKELIAVALFGALAYCLAFIGIVLVATTGIAAASGIWGGIAVGIVWAILFLTIRRFGSVTIAMTLYSILAIPVPLFGSPGIYKPIVGFIAGLTYDSVGALFKNRKLGCYFGWAIASVIVWLGLAYFIIALGLPKADKMMEALPLMIPISLATGVLGSFLGIRIYGKIKHKQIIKQFRD